MKKLLLLGLALALAPCLRADDAAADDGAAATAIHLTGSVQYEEDGGQLKPVEEGQLFEAGDRLVTGDGATLELALADGSTLSLGSNAEMMVHAVGRGGDGSQSFFEVLKGRMNAMVHALNPGASFEVGTSNSVAAVKGTQFEVSAEGPTSAVTVQEGSVAMSDASRQRTVMVPPLQRAEARADGLGAARPLRPDEARAFTQRWAAARAIHARRQQLLRKLRPLRRRHLARLHARRGWLQKRLKAARLQPDKHPAWAAARKRAQDQEAQRKGRGLRRKQPGKPAKPE